MAATKSLTTTSSLASEGNLIRIYGVYRFYYEPQYNNVSLQVRPLFHEDPLKVSSPAENNALFKYDGSRYWVREDGKDCYFMERGVHKLFGWTKIVDGIDAKELFAHRISTEQRGSTAQESTLYVTEQTLDAEENSSKFDFLYSDVVLTGTNEQAPSTGDITLHFKHLFSPITLTVKNLDKNDITVRNVEVSGLKNYGAALITFADAGSSVEYRSLEERNDADGHGFVYQTFDNGGYLLSGCTSAGAEESVNVFTHTSASDYRFIWPQNSSITLTLTYDIGGVTKTKTGRYDLSLQQDHGLTLSLKYEGEGVPLTVTATPLEWDYIDHTINVAPVSVQGTPLSFDVAPNGEYTISGSTVTISPDHLDEAVSIRCRFTPTSPVGSKWMVGLAGDTDYFEIDQHSGTIDGTQVILTITTKPEVTRSRDHSIHLRFDVQDSESGLDVDASRELNPTNYTITLPYLG